MVVIASNLNTLLDALRNLIANSRAGPKEAEKGHGSNQGNSPAAELAGRAPSRSFGPGTPRRAFPDSPPDCYPNG